MRKHVWALSCFVLLLLNQNNASAQQAIGWPLTLPVRPTLPLPLPSIGGYLVSWSVSGAATSSQIYLNPSAVPMVARYNIVKFCPTLASGASGTYAAAINTSGRAIVWSSTGMPGQLTSTEKSVPNGALSGVSDLVVTSYMNPIVLALKQDGTLIAWDPSSETLVQLPSELQNDIVAISAPTSGAPQNGILALKSSGLVISAEISQSGGWPQVSFSLNLKPVPPEAQLGIVKISHGENGVPYAFREDGKVISWNSGIMGNEINLPSEHNSGVVDIQSSVALLQNGKVIEWDAGNLRTTTPSELNANVAAIAIPLWGSTRIALTKDGKVLGWDIQGNIRDVPSGLNSGIVKIGYKDGSYWALTNQGRVATWQDSGATTFTLMPSPASIQGGVLSFYVGNTTGTSPHFAIVGEDQAVSVYCGLPLDVLADLVARRIGLNPLNYGLAPKTYVDDVAGAAQARGVASVTQNPRTYSLYTQSEYQTSQATGVNAVLASPNAWSLYTAGQIQDMSIGNPLLTKNQNGTFVLNYDIEQSNDLKTWTPYRVKAEELTGLPTDKAFVRIKAKQ